MQGDRVVQTAEERLRRKNAFFVELYSQGCQTVILRNRPCECGAETKFAQRRTTKFGVERVRVKCGTCGRTWLIGPYLVRRESYIDAHKVSTMRVARRQGASYRSIAAAMGVSVSTAFKHTRGVQP